jgi:Leucine-rich repeat (LRR) protein
MTTVFMEKENKEKGYCQFWEITLDTEKAQTKTAFGNDDHNIFLSPTREIEKKFDDSEKAEKYFNKAIKDKEKGGFVLSDRKIPLKLRLLFEQAKKGELKSLDINLVYPEPLKEICSLSNLEELKIECRGRQPGGYPGPNSFPIPPELGSLVNLKSLDLSRFTGSLPPEIGHLQSLETLAVTRSAITSIPAEIGHLVNLKVLNLNSNQISSVPEGLGNLIQLKKLVLSSNKITILPSIEKLTQLETVDLSDNLFTSFPQDLCTLTNLEKIYLDDNDIPSVDPQIKNLNKLKRLNLSRGREYRHARNTPSVMTEFPQGLIGHPSLERLGLSNQGITTLPKEILKMTTLDRLELEGNPLNINEDALWEARFSGVKPLIEFFKPKPKPQKKVEIMVEPPVCSEEERSALLIPYQAALDKVKKEYPYIRDQARLDQLNNMIAYICGESHVLPQGNYIILYSEDVLRFFQTPHDKWTFVEERLIKMMFQKELLEKRSFYKDFMSLIKNEIRRGQGEGLLNKVIPLLENEGVSREWLRDYICREFTDILFLDELSSAAGDFILTFYDSDWHKMLETASGESRECYLRLFHFFAASRPNFETHFDRLLNNPKEQGIHAPYEEWEILMDLDKERFYPRFSQLFTQVTCTYCLFRLAQIGMKHYPEVNETPLLALTDDVLKVISQKRNRDRQYKYYCPLYMENEASRASWSSSARKSLDKTYDLVQWSLKVFGEKAGPLLLNYVLGTQLLQEKLVTLCVQSLGQSMEAMLPHGLSVEISEDNVGVIDTLLSAVQSITPSAALEKRLWELLFCDFETIRDAAARALAGKSAVVMEKTAEELKSKDTDRRDGAIRLLCFERSDESRGVLADILYSEKKDNIRDLILNNWGIVWDLDLAGVRDLVQKAQDNKKLNRSTKAWLDVSALPRLYWLNGEELSDREMNYLFYRQNREKKIAPERELRAALKHIDREKSGDFAFALFEHLMANGGPAAKNRSVLTLACMLGDDRLVEPLENFTIRRNNEACPTALGLIGSDSALRGLDHIMKHFKVKYPNVKGAALTAFNKVADDRGASYYELADSIISTFGFDGLSRAITIGDTVYTLRISDTLKLVYRDEEKGKTVKTLPKAASPELKEEMKALAKNIRENAKDVLANLEQYLVIQRKWKRADWESFFLNHPLLFAMVPGLVWGVYKEDKLRAAFRISSAGEFLNADGDEIDRDLINGEIGLVHPLDMNPDELDAWKEHLVDYEIKQPFSQLDRDIHTLKEEEVNFAFCNRFADKVVSESAFKSRTEKRSWRRGSVVDGGGVDNYYKTFEKAGIEAFIELQGMCVSSIGEPAELKELYFVKQGTVITGSYTYDSPRSEGDSRLIKLKDVPAIIFSEVIGDMEFITG